MSELSSLALMQWHAETLFIHDDDGRLVFVNEPVRPEVHPAPLVFVGRTVHGPVCRCRHDLPAELCEELESFVMHAKQDPMAADTILMGAIRQRLEKAGLRIGRVVEGPAYYFGAEASNVDGCVVVDSANAHLLAQHFREIMDDLGAVQPCVVAVVNGSAVAICDTARRSPYAVEAGVETIAAYRRQGLGIKVVAKWASLVRAASSVPMYSTWWGNVASRGLAAKLGLIQYGADFHLSEADVRQLGVSR